MTPDKPKRANPLAKGGPTPLSKLKARCLYAMLCAEHGRRHAHLWDYLLNDDWFLSDEPIYDDNDRQRAVARLAWLLDHERNEGRAVNPEQRRVLAAYFTFLFSKQQPPSTDELLRELKINKPKRTESNMREWLRANNRERVIRKMLKKVGLPLLAGKRGRRW